MYWNKNLLQMIIKKSKTKFRTEQMIAKTDCQQVSEVIWFKPCILSSSEGSRQALAKTVEPEVWQKCCLVSWKIQVGQNWSVKLDFPKNFSITGLSPVFNFQQCSCLQLELLFRNKVYSRVILCSVQMCFWYNL